MNSLNLIGRLTKDPELKTLSNGENVCELRIAVDGGRENADPLYLDLAVFGAQAIACADYLTKGRQIAFEGRLVYREWENKDGDKRSKHSGVGRVEFLGSRPTNDTEAQPAEEPVAV